MSEEEPVKDSVPTKAEETTPAPENVPPVVHPKPDNELHDAVASLTAKVEELAGTVASLVESGGERDSTPVKKPWTHRFGG